MPCARLENVLICVFIFGEFANAQNNSLHVRGSGFQLAKAHVRSFRCVSHFQEKDRVLLGCFREGHSSEGVRERLVVHLHAGAVHVVVDPLRSVHALEM